MEKNIANLSLDFDSPTGQNHTITPKESNRILEDEKAPAFDPLQDCTITPSGVGSPWPASVLTPLLHGTPAWLTARRLGITASDIPIIMGVSSYSTPYQLWLDKREGSADKATKQMAYGLHLEPLLAHWVSEDLAQPCDLRNWLVVRADEPRFMATIDCTLDQQGGLPALVELKTAVGVNNSDWEEEDIPVGYYYQVQWQLYVTGAPKAYLACLPAGNANRFMVREVERDSTLQLAMVHAAEQFLYMLKNGIAPVAVADDLSKLPLSETEAEKYEPSEDFLEKYREYCKLAAKKEKSTTGLSEVEKALKDLKAKMAQMMGSKSNCTINEAGKIITISRKLIKVKAKQVAASSYQKIDIKEG